MNIEKVCGPYELYLSALLQDLTCLSLLESQSEIDHICFKVKTLEEYENKKEELEQIGSIDSEAMINGRPIACYTLFEPLSYKNYTISMLELPAPKPNEVSKSGWDHIEIVTHGNLRKVLDQFPTLNWNVSNLANPVNPDISLNLTSGKVKFHPTSLFQVIQLEKKEFFKKNGHKSIVFRNTHPNRYLKTLTSVLTFAGFKLYFSNKTNSLLETDAIAIISDEPGDEIKFFNINLINENTLNQFLLKFTS